MRNIEIDAKISSYMVKFAKASELLEKKRAGYPVSIDLEELKKIVKEYIFFCKEKDIDCGVISITENFEKNLQVFLLGEISKFYSLR
ncbi:MAG: hypothetical protein PHP54_05035 [Clostridia bacterium]|nr:hypothetical protein [Clostridia bacterium]